MLYNRDGTIVHALERAPPARDETKGFPLMLSCGPMLVGRSRELELLRAAARSAANGRGDVLALVGVPGIGKTRLADEISREAAQLGLEAHWGRAWETGGAPAYFPWTQALKSLRARAPEGTPPAVLRDGFELGAPAPLDPAAQRGGPARPSSTGTLGDGRSADPDAARFALFQSVLAFLEQAATRAPLLIVLDDMHMADVPSLELLHFVARGVRGLPLLLLPTWRDAEARQPAIAECMARIEAEARVLRPLRLEASEVAALLLDSACSLAGDPELPGLLCERTEGNPLFVHEALRLIAGGGGLEQLPRAAGVEALIRQRSRRLSAAAQAIVPAAAVLGREPSLELLCELSEQPRGEIERLCLELVSAGILERWQRGLRFTHVLIAEALVQQRPPDERRSLHARAALAWSRRVEHGDEASLHPAAHHALEALPELPAELALGLVLRAQERARARGAYEAAVTLLERARSAFSASAPAVQAEVALALGWAALDAGRTGLGRSSFELAAGLARGTRDPVLQARAALGRGAEFVFGDVREELVEMLEQALAQLPADAVLLGARLRARLAAALVPGLRAHASLPLARAAIAAVLDHPDDRAVLEVAVSAGAALQDFAPPEERARVNRELLRRARRVGDRVLELRGTSRLVIDHLEAGDVAGAAALARERDELAQHIGLPRYQWQAPLFRSLGMMLEGRFAECDRAVLEAQQLAALAHDENARRCVAIHRTWLLLLADRGPELVAHEPEVQHCVASMPPPLSFGAIVSALVNACSGNAPAARDALERLSPDGIRAHGPMAAVSVAHAALDVGHQRWLPFLREHLLPAADRNATWGPFGLVCLPPVAAVLARLELALGRPDAALALFQRALERTLAMRAPAHELWVRYWWASSLPAASPSMAARALELAQAFGMAALAERLRALTGGSPDAAPSCARPAAPQAPLASALQSFAFTLRRTERGWAIERAGRSCELRPLRGLDMIARLIENRGRELHATALAAGEAAAREGDAGELLDATALAQYRQRLAELREDVAQARRAGLGLVAEQRQEEIDALARELARAIGKGGRLRRAGSGAERARVSVQHRVREAIRKIAELDPELGRHLDWAIRTGTFCSYDPERGLG
jgi:hypothetical protein